MSKLSQTTIKVRKYVIGFLVFSIVVMLFQIIYKYVKNSDTFKPKVDYYASIDNSFGTILYPKIDTLIISDDSTPEFATNGKFPTFPSSVNVYQVKKPRETFSSLVKAEDIAKSLGFKTDYHKDGNLVIWQEDGRYFSFDRLTQDMYYKNSKLSGNKDFSSYLDARESIDNAFKKILSQLKIYTNSYRINNQYYLLDEDDSYKLVTSLDLANYLRRDYKLQYEIVSIASIYKDLKKDTGDVKPINGILYTDNLFEGEFYVIMAKDALGGDLIENLKEFKLRILDVDIDAKGVYKLKPPEVAWEDVKKGRGYLKFLGEDSELFMDYKQVKVKRFLLDINKIELAYYMPDKWTGYIYPIYIFRGLANIEGGKTVNFVFYANAIES